MFRVIDNKKVDMTNEEYNDYIRICKSYDRPHFKGEELFKDLFETNETGKIIYIKSLNNRQFTFEVIFFIMNLMQNQWLRVMTETVADFMKVSSKRIDEKILELDKIIEMNKKQ
ncbi:MAG: hypothetical protein ACOYMA_00200 [Bacteroidia bacterium]